MKFTLVDPWIRSFISKEKGNGRERNEMEKVEEKRPTNITTGIIPVRVKIVVDVQRRPKSVTTKIEDNNRVSRSINFFQTPSFVRRGCFVG